MDLIFNLLYPPQCMICSKFIDPLEKGLLCKNCDDVFEKITSPVCPRCGKPSHESSLCFDCADKKRYFEKNNSLFVYEDVIRNLIHKFKYGNHPELGRGLGDLMAENFSKELFSKIDVIIPVPIHKIRRRKRGFNQAALLAQQIANKFDIPMTEKILLRIKNTKPQSLLDATSRENNIKDAFVVCGKISDKNVLLVDDIFTTGSTINYCAKKLLDSGAQKVFSITLAMVVKNMNES